MDSLLPQTPTTCPKHVWWSLQDKSCHKPFWLSGPRGHSDDLWARHAFLFTRAYYLWGGGGGGGGEGGKSSLLWPLLASELRSVPGSKFRNENFALMNHKRTSKKKNTTTFPNRRNKLRERVLPSAGSISRFSQRGLRFSPRGLRSSFLGLRFSNTPFGDTEKSKPQIGFEPTTLRVIPKHFFKPG